jgi:hypothetical protein
MSIKPSNKRKHNNPVQELLKSLKIDEEPTLSIFTKHQVDLDALVLLTKEDLIHMGVKFGPIAKLLQFVRNNTNSAQLNCAMNDDQEELFVQETKEVSTNNIHNSNNNNANNNYNNTSSSSSNSDDADITDEDSTLFEDDDDQTNYNIITPIQKAKKPRASRKKTPSKEWMYQTIGQQGENWSEFQINTLAAQGGYEDDYSQHLVAAAGSLEIFRGWCVGAGFKDETSVDYKTQRVKLFSWMVQNVPIEQRDSFRRKLESLHYGYEFLQDRIQTVLKKATLDQLLCLIMRYLGYTAKFIEIKSKKADEIKRIFSEMVVNGDIWYCEFCNFFEFTRNDNSSFRRTKVGAPLFRKIPDYLYPGAYVYGSIHFLNGTRQVDDTDAVGMQHTFPNYDKQFPESKLRILSISFERYEFMPSEIVVENVDAIEIAYVKVETNEEATFKVNSNQKHHLYLSRRLQFTSSSGVKNEAFTNYFFGIDMEQLVQE